MTNKAIFQDKEDLAISWKCESTCCSTQAWGIANCKHKYRVQSLSQCSTKRIVISRCSKYCTYCIQG